MSRGAIQTMADRVRKSTFVLPLFIGIVILLFASIVGMGFDFYTNLAVVRELGIRSVGVWPIDVLRLFAVAVLPQFVPVVFFYIGLAMAPRNRQEEWIRAGALIVAVGITILDMWFGYVWYSGDGGRNPFLMAVIIDTLFSEVTWTVMFGLFLEFKDDAMRETRKLFSFVSRKPQPQPQSRPVGNQPSLPNMNPSRR